ncbi:MAG: electron transfer flavoprotein subunit alpha/FixB family protein [Coriobacteriia bacterium]|nr:electron transfer flavoprotein subunit alpha/FixB family protein [Coriobacteriia bacterium]
MSKQVLVFSELVRNIPELITAAKSLSESVSAVVIGSEEDAKLAIACGAQKAFLVDVVADTPSEAYASTIAAIVRDADASALLASLTPKGRAVAAFVAQMLNASCGSECKTIQKIDETYSFSRAIYGGKATSFERASTEVFVATIPLRSFEAAASDQTNQGEIIRVASQAATYPVKIVEVVPREGDSVDVTTASVVVCVGRGVVKEDDLPMVNELAEAIGGVVGCTRPIAMDFKWFPQDRYIGLSGKSIKPKLFIGVGVSGQIQCLAGANDSKVIVGINKDENAPIFEYSDYGVVADLYEFVPALIASIKSL